MVRVSNFVIFVICDFFERNKGRTSEEEEGKKKTLQLAAFRFVCFSSCFFVSIPSTRDTLLVVCRIIVRHRILSQTDDTILAHERKMKKKKREHFRAVALRVSVLLLIVFVVSPLKLVKDYEKSKTHRFDEKVEIRFADSILNDAKETNDSSSSSSSYRERRISSRRRNLMQSLLSPETIEAQPTNYHVHVDRHHVSGTFLKRVSTFLSCKTECAGFTLELMQFTPAYECVLVGRGYGLVADEFENVHTFYRKKRPAPAPSE